MNADQTIKREFARNPRYFFAGGSGTWLLFHFACGRAKAATSAPALLDSFALFGRHVFPALGHATAEVGTTRTTPSMVAEEDPAERQNSNRLPEGKLAPSEERRQQPIPQMHHYFAADEDKERNPQDRRRSYPKQSPSPVHVQFPRGFTNYDFVKSL
jgi:hypothetical protein